MNNLGELIKGLRIAKNLTQEQLGIKLGKSASIISSYETSQRQPSLLMIKRLATEFGVTTDYLLDRRVNDYVEVEGLNKEQVEAVVRVVTAFQNDNL